MKESDLRRFIANINYDICNRINDFVDKNASAPQEKDNLFYYLYSKISLDMNISVNKYLNDVRLEDIEGI